MVAQLSLITSVLLASTTTSSTQPSSTALSSTNLISTITATFNPSTTLFPSARPSAFGNASSLANVKPQTTVSLFNACAGSDSICADTTSITYYGAVLSADATKTAYKLDCAKYAGNVTECFPTPLTVTQGSSLFVRSDATGITPVTISCNILEKTKSAVCEQKMSKAGAVASAFPTGAPKNSVNGTAVSTSTLTFGASQIHYNSLIITSGAEKLASATATTATNTPKVPTSTGSASSPTKTGDAVAIARTPCAAVAGFVAVFFAVFAY